MNLATGAVENKTNKADSMWFTGHRTTWEREEKEEKAKHLEQEKFLSLYLASKVKVL